MTGDLVYFEGGRLRRESGLPVDVGGTVTPEDVRDAGRWEVAVHLVPAVEVLTPDESDWVYGWVSD